jgi:hypothetical protein
MNSTVKLARYKGAVLREILIERHRYRGQSTGGPLSVLLEFDAMPPMHIGGSADGWQLRIDHDRPAPSSNLQEHGTLELERIPDAAEAVNHCLKEICVMRLRDYEQPISLRFVFDGIERPLFILVWDDELHIGDRLPADAAPTIDEDAI